MTNIFEIENLDCKYPGSAVPVLKIEKLSVKSGSIVFFIGASGVGKSTILETLGLMNNTISSNPNTKFLFKTGNTELNLLTIWAKGEAALSKFRSKHLSFIFQQTNLFPHLTVHENANIVQVIQGQEYLQANQKTKNIFHKLSLNFGRSMSPKVTHISGGQRQRIAFARAISSQYDVLFADEPTGNLDWSNAENLMSVLVTNVKESNRTAIIVSHDISLAVRNATSIVVIQKKMDESNHHAFGYINEKLVFDRDTGASESDRWFGMNKSFSPEELENTLKIILKEQSDL